MSGACPEPCKRIKLQLPGPALPLGKFGDPVVSSSAAKSCGQFTVNNGPIKQGLVCRVLALRTVDRGLLGRGQVKDPCLSTPSEAFEEKILNVGCPLP